MNLAYTGPLRSEPIAIELHNTIYAAGGELRDGLADAASADAFAHAIAARAGLDPPGASIHAELLELRESLRAGLSAAALGEPQAPAQLAGLNAAAARAPTSPRAELVGSTVALGVDRHGAAAGDVLLAAFAVDAIELIAEPARGALRVCAAPGCVLMFVKDHPRRAWCSNACGNRARQARHYHRRRSTYE